MERASDKVPPSPRSREVRAVAASACNTPAFLCVGMASYGVWTCLRSHARIRQASARSHVRVMPCHGVHIPQNVCAFVGPHSYWHVRTACAFASLRVRMSVEGQETHF